MPDLLTQFKSIARETAEAAFKQDRELFLNEGYNGFIENESKLTQFQETVKDLQILLANLQLDVESDVSDQELTETITKALEQQANEG